MSKYLYNTESELRAAFWDYCDENHIIVPDHYGFSGEVAGMFFDWTDAMAVRGDISWDLCDSTNLYDC